MNHWLFCAFLVMLAMMGPLAVRAEDIAWANPAGGSFGLDVNWDGEAVPGVDDRALFWLGASPAYTVTNDQVRTIDSLEVSGDNVILDLNGNNLTLNQARDEGTTLYGLAVGLSASGSLTVRGGGELTMNSFSIGGRQGFSTSAGLLRVSGSGTRVVFQPTSGFETLLVGNRGPGTLEILNGGEFSTSLLNASRTSTSRSVILVAGSNSLLDVANTLYVPHADCTITVTNGATFRLRQAGVPKRYDLSVRIEDARMEVFGSGGIEGLRLANSNETVPCTATLEVLSGGLLAITNLLRVGAGGNGTAHVRLGRSRPSGFAGRMIVHGNVEIAGTDVEAGGVGSLVVEDGGEAEIGKTLRLWPQATLTLSNGTVRAGDLVAVEGARYAPVLSAPGGDAPLQILARNALDGDVALGDATLDPLPGEGFDPGLNGIHTLLRYEGELTGTFKDLPEGATVLVGGAVFRLNYGTGENSAITLVPPLGTVIFLR